MSIRLVLLLHSVLQLSGAVASAAQPSVQFAAVIFRHGARTPVASYPNDPWRNESLWPNKFGELTNVGKLQHYRLGRWLRRRYSGLLSTRFDPKEIFLQSTAIDRSIMSVMANSAGLFPPIKKDIWDPDISWQPIPVRTVPEYDEVLTMNKACPHYHAMLSEYKKSAPYLQELKKYRGLMKYLSTYSGQDITNFDDIEYLYSTLSIEFGNNFTLPPWTDKVFPDAMREPAGYSFTIPSATADLARLKTGPLLKQIAGLMESFSRGRESRRVHVYSGHDTTVANVLQSLGLLDVHCPPFTATVFIELVTDEADGGYMVRVSYRNSSDIVEPRVLSVPACGELCPLPRFLALYSHLTSVNWEQECTQQLDFYPWLWMVGASVAIFVSYLYASKLFFTYVRVARLDVVY